MHLILLSLLEEIMNLLILCLNCILFKINFCFIRYFGGWVCKNIYYLGFSGIININGLTIGGISGIYKSFDFYKGIKYLL